MGLDMYLTRKLYVKNWSHMKPEEKTAVTVIRGGEQWKQVDPTKVKYIEEEAAYWRKANQVHRWFVERVQKGQDDCRNYYVSVDQLRELLKLAEEVKANPLLAPELLPTQSGCFFGQTDYGESYMQDIDDTISQLTPIVNRSEDDGEYYYSSSW